jgi:hypothetical protein
LPGVWFSEREIHALLTMHQLIQGLDEGGVLARHLQPLLDKLHGMLGASRSAVQEKHQRCPFDASPGSPASHSRNRRQGRCLQARSLGYDSFPKTSSHHFQAAESFPDPFRKIQPTRAPFRTR